MTAGVRVAEFCDFYRPDFLDAVGKSVAKRGAWR